MLLHSRSIRGLVATKTINKSEEGSTKHKLADGIDSMTLDINLNLVACSLFQFPSYRDTYFLFTVLFPWCRNCSRIPSFRSAIGPVKALEYYFLEHSSVLFLAYCLCTPFFSDLSDLIFLVNSSIEQEVSTLTVISSFLIIFLQHVRVNSRGWSRT